jgi:hypothetical protein
MLRSWSPLAAIAVSLWLGLLLIFFVDAAAAATSATPATPATTATAPPPADIADFMVNIARYASWPKSGTPKSLTACYALGAVPSAPVAPSALTGYDWVVKGVPVVWMSISTPQQVSGCNIIWLSADVRPAPRRWITAVADQPVLTLSNYADFAADGGIVGAYRVGPDWRFEINIEALQRSGVNISASALRLSQKPRAIIGAAGAPGGAGTAGTAGTVEQR